MQVILCVPCELLEEESFVIVMKLIISKHMPTFVIDSGKNPQRIINFMESGDDVPMGVIWNYKGLNDKELLEIHLLYGEDQNEPESRFPHGSVCVAGDGGLAEAKDIVLDLVKIFE